MVLHASGTIFASQIASEYNRNTSGTFFLGSNGRTLDSRVPQSGGINFSSFYNKYSRPATSNLRVWLDAKEYSGSGTTWTDLQGNANATLVNAPTYAKPYFDFNGTSQYVTLPDIDNTTDFGVSGNYTISFWIWPSSSQVSTDNSFIEKWDEVGGYSYVFRYVGNPRSLTVASYNGATGAGSNSVLTNFVQNDWNHISGVFSWTTNTLTVYVNNSVLFTTSISLTGTITNTSLLNIMRRGVNAATFYTTGRFGMLMIHNAALAASEVSRMYYATRNVFEIDANELEHGTWNVLYEYINPKRNASNALVTSKDNSSSLGTQLVNRVGYFMQNNMGNGSVSYWILVTMDAYTTTLSQLKIPDITTAFTNQRNVTNLRIYSNHPQVGNYTAANGRLEIWPWGYDPQSNLGGGNGAIYDFDDTTPGSGDYGSVQVHDITNSKTLLAWNDHRYNVGTVDVGIGNNNVTNINYSSAAGNNTDWTFAQNGAYNWKFQVLTGTIPFEPTILDSGAWRTVYELTTPTRNVSGALTFSVNNATVLGSPTFTRIGYYMQNNMGNGATSYWIFVSMDAYTSTLTQLRIPDITNIFVNQRNVTNLQIFSNHPQVGNYTVASGRLEIWPYNYSATSNLGGGSGSVYDFDDTHNGNGDYGSVQIHDITNSKTILAWNRHGNGATPDIGIGNNDATNINYVNTGIGATDWTAAQNGAFNWKFQVLINNVALNPATLESGTWNLLYELTNPMRNANGMLTFTKNNAALLGNRQFTKVGYYMQNNMGNGPTSYYVYVTMDAYTTSLRDLKIPDNVDAFINQRNVRNLQIYSNHPQVGNYTAANGRLEIWPYNYAGTTTFGDGSSATYDFDDTPNIVADGHGSVQVHDITNSKTILAWNRHGNGRVQDIGFGTNNVSNINYVAGAGLDWTEAVNGAYNWKFQVYIKI
jgi:hypothetical protein